MRFPARFHGRNDFRRIDDTPLKPRGEPRRAWEREYLRRSEPKRVFLELRAAADSAVLVDVLGKADATSLDHLDRYRIDATRPKITGHQSRRNGLADSGIYAGDEIRFQNTDT